MTKDKQIDEMYKDVKCIHRCFLEDDDFDYLDEYIAVKLYKKGYRKSTDLAREIFEEIEGNILHIVNHKFIECQRHHEHNSYTQMLQAQISVLRILLNYIAELKKKYAEEDL